MDFSTKVFILISMFFATSVARGAEIFYAPALCAPEEMMIFVANKTAEPQKWWTQVYHDGLVDEVFQEVDAKAEMKISGTSFWNGTQGFALKALNANTLRFTLTCPQQKMLLGSVTSPFATHYFPTGISALKLSLLNLYLNSNQVTLKAFDLSGALIEEKYLRLEKHYDTQNLKWILNRDVARVEISGAARLHSEIFFGDDERQSPPVAMTPATLQPDLNKKYFLVAAKGQSPNGSFVIALDDEEKIRTAREQITTPELEKIVVARIALGNDQHNRAFNSRDKSPYSWSVTDVDAFADFAHIDCDGSPDLIEERLQQRLNEGGRICFWRYRVVRELSLPEVITGILKP
ncbi:MAG: hypothetical protein J7501_14805 [Bdellovibrio sp.]|nr:hypothetical protein [Bdellovibrio sp.]